MKIDLHCHTLKCKNGDGEKRNVTAELFKEKIELADVQIVGVTNHNYFDKKQYNELKEIVQDFCEVWPGIELDVKEYGDNNGHVLVLCSPLKVDEFDKRIKNFLVNKTPDEFVCSVSTMCSTFNDLNVVYIPHFFKDHQLCEKDMELLDNNAYSKTRILREPSDIKSIGVLNANGYRSIIGSDVKGWDNYEDNTFAELKYPIKGFENFLKLLDKDTAFIKDLINNDLYETITVYGNAKKQEYPFEIDIYNDVNVIFGDKGSGKTEILDSLEKYFNEEKGMNVVKYSGGDKTSWFSDLLKENVKSYTHEIFGIDDYNEEFKLINEYKDTLPIKVEEYSHYFSNISKNKKRKKLLILKQDKVFTSNFDLYHTYYKDYEFICEFSSKLPAIVAYKNHSDKYSTLINQISQLKKDAYIISLEEWKKQWADFLTDNIIEKMNTYSSESDGTPKIPKETGFYKFAKNRINLFTSILAIQNELYKNEKVIENTYIGKIGEKGSGYLKSYIGFINLSNYKDIDSNQIIGKKTNIKVFLKYIQQIKNNCFSEELISQISSMNENKTEPIDKIDYFIYARKEFTLKDSKYKPSKGEMAILSLQYELLNKTENDVFLIDEPEVNLGSTYIEETIVPLIKDLAKAKKKVIIATHDANIATRTYPVTSILKKSSNNVYDTYQGSMFTNELLNKTTKEKLKWDHESEKYLEGGLEAFEERGTLYGTRNKS